MKLRKHQTEGIQSLRDSLGRGNKRPLLAAPCSYGKTLVAATIMLAAAEKGKKSVFFCDRIKLLSQTVEAFDALGADYSVLQGDDPRYDPRKLIQIVSVQTAVRRGHFVFDLAIVDECHQMYKGLIKIMERFDNVPFIGLSATPYSKGLGKYYDDLIIPITPRQLIEQGYLCPTEYYVGKTINTKGLKTKALATGGSDFDEKSLGQAMIDDEVFNGDIVENYIAHSGDKTKRAIAFSPSVAHSKSLVERLNKAGVPALHIDGYMPQEERKFIYDDHLSGRALGLSCSRLLGVGFDDPGIEILIDCFPCKSKINWIQRAGRIWRTAAGKEKAIYLDHAGNLQRHGCFPEDVIPDHLDSGEKKFNEKNQTKKEEKEPIIRACPVCAAAFTGRKCACGYQLSSNMPVLKDTGGLLKKAETITLTDKGQFFGELATYANDKGYADGWISHKYREKFGVWPQGIDRSRRPISLKTYGWIKSRQIARAKARA